MDLTSLPERIREKITLDGECWIWTGCLVRGYGQWQLPGTKIRVKVHRYVYEALVGPILDGLEIDHLCRRRSCCFPGHLEPVTPLENMRRWMDLITHCPQGHIYDDEVNTYTDKRGCRSCKQCAADRDRVRRAAGYVRPSRRKVGV